MLPFGRGRRPQLLGQSRLWVKRRPEHTQRKSRVPLLLRDVDSGQIDLSRFDPTEVFRRQGVGFRRSGGGLIHQRACSEPVFNRAGKFAVFKAEMPIFTSKWGTIVVYG